jgi:hypothetical protein
MTDASLELYAGRLGPLDNFKYFGACCQTDQVALVYVGRLAIPKDEEVLSEPVHLTSFDVSQRSAGALIFRWHRRDRGCRRSTAPTALRD